MGSCMSDLIDSPPLEPKRLSVRIERSAGRLRLVSAQRQWAGAAFLLVWLTGWTFGCVVLLGVVIAYFSFFMLLFAIPFWAAELFVFSLVGTMIASREVFELNSDGLAYRWTVWGWPVSRRHVPLSEIVGLEDGLAPPTSDSNQAFAKTGRRLTLQTIGEALELPGGHSFEEQRWVQHLISETLDKLKRNLGPIERGTAVAPAGLPSPGDLPAVLELRPPSAAEVPRPSDSTWSYRYDFDAITFSQRGRLQTGGLGMLLFVNAFWNGITGVFVAGLWGFLPDGQKMAQGRADWWFLFFFLIPFQLIGLLMLVGLLAVLIQPLRRSRWSFTRNAICYRLSYLGLGKTWQYEVRELDRLELRKGGAKQKDEEQAADDDAHDDDDRFSVAFVDSSRGDVCEIDDLTLGEACWIADVVLRERKGWFR